MREFGTKQSNPDLTFFIYLKKAMPQLLDQPINIKIRLAAMWTSLMFCYIYCDYFQLYLPGKLNSMMESKMGPLGEATPGVMMGVSIMMAIPSLMIFLSVVLGARINKILQIIFGLAYSLIMILVILPGLFDVSNACYTFFGLIEIILTLSIVWVAFRWPRT